MSEPVSEPLSDAFSGLLPRPPDWAALMASTRSAFFIEPAPETPSPEASDFRSAMSIELSPPARFLGAEPPPSEAGVVDSMVSVT